MAQTISVGLIHCGGALTVNIKRLARLLNSLQKVFRFEIAGKPYLFYAPTDYFIQDFDGTGHSFYKPETIINKAASYKKGLEYLIVITGLRIAEDYDEEWFHIKRFAPECRYKNKERFPDLDYFTDEDKEKGISVMTEYNYHKFCKETKISVYDYFAYLISCSILSLMAREKQDNFLAHKEVRGCIGDYCYDQKEIVQSILSAGICPECIGDLKNHNFTEDQIEAIKKIIKYIIKKKTIRKIQRGFFYWYCKLSQDLISIVLIGVSTSLIASIFNKPWAKISAFAIILGLLTGRIISVWKSPYKSKPN